MLVGENLGSYGMESVITKTPLLFDNLDAQMLIHLGSLS
jgi:hypothetical protein